MAMMQPRAARLFEVEGPRGKASALKSLVAGLIL
jgi:hypothetical protein